MIYRLERHLGLALIVRTLVVWGLLVFLLWLLQWRHFLWLDWPWWLRLQMTLPGLPWLTSLSLPVALLVAKTHWQEWMSKNHAWSALASMGYPTWRYRVVWLLWVVFLGVFSSVCMHVWHPQAQRWVNELGALSADVQERLRPGQFVSMPILGQRLQVLSQQGEDKRYFIVWPSSDGLSLYHIHDLNMLPRPEGWSLELGFGRQLHVNLDGQIEHWADFGQQQLFFAHPPAKDTLMSLSTQRLWQHPDGRQELFLRVALPWLLLVLGLMRFHDAESRTRFQPKRLWLIMACDLLALFMVFFASMLWVSRGDLPLPLALLVMLLPWLLRRCWC